MKFLVFKTKVLPGFHRRFFGEILKEINPSLGLYGEIWTASWNKNIIELIIGMGIEEIAWKS